jgi:5'-methylthioadenosine phosphorylase
MNPTLACIGGHAAYDLLRDGALEAERLGPLSTPFGESETIYVCRAHNGGFYLLARHGESAFALVPGSINYRANVCALKQLGVQTIVSWSETRAISHNFKIGQYVLVSDLIDETRSRPRTFFEQLDLGDVRQWPVFCPRLQRALTGSLKQEECDFAPQGVYVCVEGPRRETPAEARKYASFGGELLGSTLAPEVFLAKELQMCYASLCYVASYAENGSDFRPFENGRILEPSAQRERAQAAVERFPRILARLCQELPQTESPCDCASAMQEHIERGRVSADWKTWFERPASPRQHAPDEQRFRPERSAPQRRGHSSFQQDRALS